MDEMQTLSDAQLLRDYAERGAETAFAEIVARHTDLVYSAALRQVYSPDLAREVTQSVFTDLARKARTVSASLSPQASLVGWLYRGTRFAARDLYRNETRRNQRERQAMEQFLSAPETAPDWEQLRPVLDDAMSELDDTDRDAVLLRYFKNHDLRTVGATLGISDDAAQKRVSRAVERLREFFAKRGVTVGASGLAIVISANAVQAAPVGLAITISTAAALTGTNLATTATVTATKAVAMTALQKTIFTATIVVLAAAGIYEARQASNARAKFESIQQRQAPLAEQIRQLTRERDDAAGRLAALREDIERMNQDWSELLRLRGEVGRLRNETSDLAENAGKKTDSAGNSMLEGIRWRPEWRDAGLSSPEATLETYFWAQANGNIDRLKEMMVFDRGTNIVPVSDLYAKREARQDGDNWRAATLGGVRIHRKFFSTVLNPDRASFEVESMGPGAEGGKKVAPNMIVDAKAIPADPANPPTWSPTRSEGFDLVSVDSQWKIVRREYLTRMAIDDEDSEAMAKMMMQMDPETLEKLKADPRLPAETLRAYEELKSKSAK